MRLVVATRNEHKLRELAEILTGFELLALPAGVELPPEDGATFEENALIKARAAAQASGILSLGDDSGIEVDALGGAPGLYSARFGGPGLDDAGRYRLLLDRLYGVPAARRTARFRCVVALVHPDGGERVVEGAVEGVIAEAPRGAGGFGYDPVFFYPPPGRTFGELPAETKHCVDHRGAAIRAARALLVG